MYGIFKNHRNSIPRCIMLLLSCLMLVGCGQKNQTEADDIAANSPESSDMTKTEQAEPGIPREEIKIGVLYIADPSVGSGYSYTHDLGIQAIQQNVGLDPSQIVRHIISDENPEQTKKVIGECIEEGCNIIFGTSFGYMDAMEEMAALHPHVYFAHGSGYKSNGKNFVNYFGRIYQARYLSGIAAGLKTQTNKIGYVAAQGLDNSEVTGGINAFALGVASVNPDAALYVDVTNSWYDPDEERAAAIRLLNAGCDVLAQHCDTNEPSLMAQERGVWSIGYNSDAGMEAPNAALCSVIWNWGAFYTEAVQNVIEGSWDGSNYYGGMRQGLVSITAFSDLNVPGAEELIREMEQKIIKGEFNVFDGVLKTNDGRTIGQEGTTLDDSTITSGIDWYNHNVTLLNIRSEEAAANE